MRALEVSPIARRLPMGVRFASGAVAVVSTPTTIAAGSARSVDQIEAQLRAFNDRGKPLYFDTCVWGGPVGCIGDSGFWIYDTAFPGLAPTTRDGRTSPVTGWPCVSDGRTAQTVKTATLAMHLSRPPYTGLDAKFSPGGGRDPYAFIGLQFDVPCEQASMLFLYDAYEECRLALAFLLQNAATITSDVSKRPIFCSEVGRYVACLYDCAARPVPQAAVDLLAPYASSTGVVTLGDDRVVRVDAVEAVLGRPLRDEDLVVRGPVAMAWSSLLASATSPWAWNDAAPVACLVPATNPSSRYAFGRTSKRTGAQVVNDAAVLAQYTSTHTMAQLLLAEWTGYTTGPLAAFAQYIGVSADQLAKMQTDAQKAKTLADAHAATSAAGALARVVPVVGQALSQAVGWIWDLLSQVLPIASGTLPACPPPFLLRVPKGGACPPLNSGSALQNAMQGVLATTTAAGVESVHHDVPPPSFAFINHYVQAKQSAASSAMWRKVAIGTGIAATLGLLVWIFRSGK